MGADFLRLKAEPSSQSTTPRPRTRKVHRHTINAEATISNSHGQSAVVTVGDISTHGCSIEGPASWLRPGAFIAVQLGQDKPIQAIVRWLRDGMSGIEFLRPITADQRDWHATMAALDSW